jgi:predicted DNA-binding transcriptional regulator AlpA
MMLACEVLGLNRSTVYRRRKAAVDTHPKVLSLGSWIGASVTVLSTRILLPVSA